MSPPRLARALLRLLTPADDRDDVVADADEIFQAKAAVSPVRAHLWYNRQALAALGFLYRRSIPHARAGWVRGIGLDVRHAVRLLAHSPGFTAVAVLSLALGIGATTSLYAAMRVALLDTLALRSPEQLRVLYWRGPDNLVISQYNSGGYADPASGKSFRTNVSYPNYRAIAQADPQAVAFNFLPRLILEADGFEPRSAAGLIVSGNAFSELGIPMALGGGLSPADDHPSAPSRVVLSHAFWHSALAADPAIVGRAVRIRGVPFIVAGVTASAFRGLSTGGRFSPHADYIVTTAAQPLLWIARGGPGHHAPNVHWLRVITRLADWDEAAKLARLRAALTQSLTDNGVIAANQAGDVAALLRPGARGVDALSTTAERPLKLLAAVVAAVVLIACVNLAALMLARGVARQRELALRQALGAARGRVVRQLLVESLTLACAGGLAGLLMALWMRPVVASMMRTGFDAPSTPLPFDGLTIAVAGLATVAACVLFGLMPAVRLTSGNLISRLRQHTIGAASPRVFAGRWLLGLQIAASIPLIVAAVLLLRTLHNLDRVDPGFRAENIVVFRLDGLPAPDADPVRHKQQLSHLIERLQAIPEVASATLIENVLLSGLVSNNVIRIDGREGSILMNGVGPRFFETFDIPLLAGRAPALDDDRAAPNVAVINQAAAAKFFGPGNPIGRRFTLGPRDVEVIGIAADSRYDGIRTAAKPVVFDAYLQRLRGNAANVIVRTRVSGGQVLERIRQTATQAVPHSAVVDLRTQQQQIEQLSGRERLLARLLALFGIFALILACVGLYGATSYTVARRTSEIGIRMALGARKGQILWMVLRSVVLLTVAGVVAGFAAAIATSKLLTSFLYGLEPHDPIALALSAILMLMVSVGAAALPALRASRIEPLRALRQE